MKPLPISSSGVQAEAMTNQKLLVLDARKSRGEIGTKKAGNAGQTEADPSGKASLAFAPMRFIRVIYVRSPFPRG